MLKEKTSEHLLLSKVKYFFHKRKGPQRIELNDFLESFCEGLDLDCLILGGLLRDLSISGTSNFKSDIDIVITGNKNNFKNKILELSLKYKCEKNKFDGFRFYLQYWVIDIWHIQETWAFVNGDITFNNELSLLETVLFNWDAIYYSYKKKKLFFKDDYFNDLNDGILQVVNSSNPNPSGSLGRILKFINRGDVLLRPELLNFYLNSLEVLMSENKIVRDDYYKLYSEILKHQEEAPLLLFEKTLKQIKLSLES